VLLIHSKLNVALLNSLLQICLLTSFLMRYNIIFTKIYKIIKITIVHILNRENRD